MVEIKELKVLEKIDYLGFNLQCTERILTYIFDSFYKNVMYYIILFKDVETFVGNENFNKFIFQKAGLREEMVYGPKENFVDAICTEIDQKNRIVLYSDHFYNPNYQENYQKKHSKHPFTVKGYDKEKKEFLIIDEDKEVLDQINKFHWWPYKEMTISFEELEKRCCAFVSKGHQGCYLYRRFHADTDFKKSKQFVMNEYKNYLEKFIRKEIDLLNEFKSRILKLQDGNEIGIDSIYDHNKSINRQNIFWDLMEIEKPEGYDENREALVNYYEGIYHLLLKYNRKKDKSILDKAIGKIDSIMSLELEQYKNFIWMSEKWIEEECYAGTVVGSSTGL